MVSKDEIIALFFQVARQKSAYTREQLEQSNPNIGQYRCLVHIAEYEPIRQKELAEALMIRPSSLSELLKKMEQKQWIQRKANETDKRVSYVTLTDEGRQQLTVYKGKRDKYISDRKNLLANLSEEEREQFYYLLKKIITPSENND
ncbi:MAG: MarR family winged helix-turn-helix transcriptional regulator [Enterococcus sp.]